MRDHMTEWSVRFCEVDRLAMSSSVGSEGDDYYASACGERKGGGEKGMKGLHHPPWRQLQPACAGQYDQPGWV